MTGTRRSNTPYRWIILSLALIAQASVSLLQQAPAALGPVLIHSLGINRAGVGLLFASTYGGMILTILLAGLLVDRHGERIIIVLGITAMSLLALAAAWAGSFAVLFGLLFLAGIGGATASPGGSRAISTWFARSQLGMALGIRQTGVTVGGLVAALVLPPVALRFGWEGALRVAALLALSVVLAFVLFYRERPGQRRARAPLRSIVRNPHLITAALYSFVFSGAQGCAISYLALFAHQVLALPIATSGILLAVLQAGGITGRTGWGIISDRVGRRGPIMLLVSVLAALAVVGMTMIGPDAPLLVVTALIFVLGVSVVGWNGLFFTIVSEIGGTGGAATATGASLTVTYLGPFVIPPLFGMLVDWTNSYQVSWLALAGWTVLGIGLAVLIWRGERIRRTNAASATSAGGLAQDPSELAPDG